MCINSFTGIQAEKKCKITVNQDKILIFHNINKYNNIHRNEEFAVVESINPADPIIIVHNIY